MRTRLLVTASVLGLAALLSGCATTASTSPTGSPSATAAPTETPDEMATAPADITVGWVANGTMIGIVTTGSSTCVPAVMTVTGEGDTIAVSLTDPELLQPCTRDLQPRVTGVAVPPEVDVTKPVTVEVTYNDATTKLELAAADEPIADATAMMPSAGYVGPNAIGLVTYGSSTCVPEVESTTAGTTDESLVVTLLALDPMAPCTADYAPRVTLVPADAGVKTLTVVDGETSTDVEVLANGF